MSTNPVRCALIVGHTPVSPGVVNRRSRISEHAFNSSLAVAIAAAVNDGSVARVDVVHRDPPNDYRGLPEKVNGLNPDFAIELHANSPGDAYKDQIVSGTEVLFWHRSRKGVLIAGVLQRALLDALGLRDRGVKKIGTRGERGFHLLAGTRCPCVIAEPFFLTNDGDLRRAQTRRADLVRAYAAAIERSALLFSQALP